VLVTKMTACYTMTMAARHVAMMAACAVVQRRLGKVVAVAVSMHRWEWHLHTYLQCEVAGACQQHEGQSHVAVGVPVVGGGLGHRGVLLVSCPLMYCSNGP
jgi:hypothetical protein